MAKDKYSKGIGNRTSAGSGASWASADEPAPRPMGDDNTPELPRDESPRRELRPPDSQRGESSAPKVRPPVAEVEEPSDREVHAPVEAAPPAVTTNAPVGPGLMDQMSTILTQLGDMVIDAGRFIMTRVIRPSGRAISRQWQVIREKIGMEDRLIEGDTYDPDRARDWEKFKKGKRSSSYLQDDVDDKK